MEFDTHHNQEWDPCSGLEDHDHVGIDINGMATSLTKEWYTTKDERVYDVNITYHATSNNLTVFFTGYKDNITNKQKLSAVVDLRQKLPEWVEFGFTSPTGWYYEYHTLFSWSFNSNLDFEAHKERKTEILKETLGLGGFPTKNFLEQLATLQKDIKLERGVLVESTEDS
ncbi:hypothetical protein PIB30_053007 [Stylosanthes scabra]|uniref:Legume lectin domain-containing protein n=1 Tax=Stylosanthes scabra TaxID=79078 RepID=A0ABU6ZH61_9FABA|nr:hypothetical protein [Stylosanthes scabra]